VPGAGFASRGIVWRPLHPGSGKTRYPAADLRRSRTRSSIGHRSSSWGLPPSPPGCRLAAGLAPRPSERQPPGLRNRAWGATSSRHVCAACTARSSAIRDRRRSSQQLQSGQGRVDLQSLSLGHWCSAESLPPVIATAVRAPRSEGDRVIRIALATLVLPPGLPCLAVAEASSDLASRPAPGLVKAWGLLPTGEVLSRPRASACASGETHGYRWWLRHLTPPKSLLAPRGPRTARGACGQ
jgi:hypothetical protein